MQSELYIVACSQGLFIFLTEHEPEPVDDELDDMTNVEEEEAQTHDMTSVVMETII